jgi:hypothetical protein
MLVILLYEIKLNRFFNPSFSFINNIEVNCFNAIAGGDLGELGYSGMVAPPEERRTGHIRGDV